MLNWFKAVAQPRSAAQRQKNIVFLALIIGLALVILLASSLDALVLQAGQPFSLADPKGQSTGTQIQADWMRNLLSGMLALLYILLPFAVIYLFFTKEGRKQLVPIIGLILLLLFLLNLIKPNEELIEEPAPEPTSAMQESMDPFPLSDAPEVTYESKPPGWVTPVVMAVITLILVGLGFGIYRLLRGERTAVTLNRVAQEAQEALEDLEAGGDMRLIVMRCYREMGKAVSRSQGIQRGAAVTAHEFEAVLVNKGLPREPVHGLTALFEMVRYSDLPPQEQEKTLAIACLRQIIAACKDLEAQQLTAQQQAQPVKRHKKAARKEADA